MAKLHYDDIIISKLVKDDSSRKKWKVVDILLNIESKQAAAIAKVVRRVLPPKFYVSALGPGQYHKGSIYFSK